MAATYLFLNSRESILYSSFEQYMGNEFQNVQQIKPSKITPQDCIINKKIDDKKSNILDKNPIYNFVNSFSELKWKQVFKGFQEYSFKLSKNESGKLIKMSPGAKVPLHSHSGKEYILVLEGNFSDEHGFYSKGDLQINDSKIKHTPIASEKEGCICLTITEDNLIFYGPFAPLLNIFTLIKSLILK